MYVCTQEETKEKNWDIKTINTRFRPGRKERKTMHHWDSDETAIVRQLWEKGLTHRQIAKNLPGRSAKAVMYRCINIGLRRVFEKNWSGKEEQRLLFLARNGLELDVIAKRLDRTKMSVKVKLCRLKKDVRRRQPKHQ